jgi:hypothetical protein
MGLYMTWKRCPRDDIQIPIDVIEGLGPPIAAMDA